MKSPAFTALDGKFMQKALDLADSVKGATGDNPAVGAVIYKGGKLIAWGKTQPPGKDHAEKAALKKAGKKAKGATMAVTLEPCCHIGRTGPCTRTIIEAGIKRVVVAIKDPNPKVSGKGISQLKRAGIKVEAGLEAESAAALNEDFFKFIQKGLPLVTLKAAVTLNGMIAASSGRSKWITGLKARKAVHLLRAQHDAVLVGMNTVKADNPDLTVRHVKGTHPTRIVLSSGADLPARSKLARSAHRIPTYLITAKPVKAKRCPFVNYVTLPAARGQIPVQELLKALAKLGFKSLLVEGGSGVFTRFLEQKGADILYLFISDKLLTAGLPFINGAPTASMKRALSLRNKSVYQVGDDTLVCGRLK